MNKSSLHFFFYVIVLIFQAFRTKFWSRKMLIWETEIKRLSLVAIG